MLASFCMYAPNAALHEMHASVFDCASSQFARSSITLPPLPRFTLICWVSGLRTRLFANYLANSVFSIPPLPRTFRAFHFCPVLLGFWRE